MNKRKHKEKDVCRICMCSNKFTDDNNSSAANVEDRLLHFCGCKTALEHRLCLLEYIRHSYSEDPTITPFCTVCLQPYNIQPRYTPFKLAYHMQLPNVSKGLLLWAVAAIMYLVQALLPVNTLANSSLHPVLREIASEYGCIRFIQYYCSPEKENMREASLMFMVVVTAGLTSPVGYLQSRDQATVAASQLQHLLWAELVHAAGLLGSARVWLKRYTAPERQLPELWKRTVTAILVTDVLFCVCFRLIFYLLSYTCTGSWKLYYFFITCTTFTTLWFRVYDIPRDLTAFTRQAFSIQVHAVKLE